MKSQSEIVTVDKNKCVNCYSCITVCPVKFCNNAQDNAVTVNPNMCIACGACIKACSHEARGYNDDTVRFFDEAQNNKIIAIVAPSIAANIPEHYLNLNGFLKSIGVEAIFDVSFGAELTVKSYIDYIETNKPQTVIAQPCPVIVSYIQLYQPELIPYLAPAHSPMLHTIKMIKQYYPQYCNHKVAIISPCMAKKREFEETRTGDYNITIKRLLEYFQHNHIILNRYTAVDYDNPPAERAVLFSSPGGLLRTAMRENPNIINASRKIEGQELIYKYFLNLPEEIEAQRAPLLVDCLNCTHGCNGGTGTNLTEASPDQMEYYIERRNKQMQQTYRGKTNYRHISGNENCNKILKNTRKKDCTTEHIPI